MGDSRGVPVEEAIEYMEAELAKMQAETDRSQLDMAPDEAFEKGYLAAIFDLKLLVKKGGSKSKRDT